MVRHELSRRDARRIAVRAQWLHADRPTRLLPLVRHISLLQLDPTAAVAPSADVVLWSRLGSGYDPVELARAVQERTLIELRATLRPAEDLALYRCRDGHLAGNRPAADWQEDQRDWVRANDACRREILQRLADSGPLRSRELPDTRLAGEPSNRCHSRTPSQSKYPRIRVLIGSSRTPEA